MEQKKLEPILVETAERLFVQELHEAMWLALLFSTGWGLIYYD